MNHLTASASLCGTPRPSWYIAPRLFCAGSSPCSADLVNHLTVSMKLIYYADNQIGDKGAKSIVAALEKNYVITCVDLSCKN